MDLSGLHLDVYFSVELRKRPDYIALLLHQVDLKLIHLAYAESIQFTLCQIDDDR